LRQIALAASLSVVQSAAAGAAAGASSQQQVPSIEKAQEVLEELYLEVSINQVPTGKLARFVINNGRLSASAATLTEFDLNWPGRDTMKDPSSGLVALDSLKGLRVTYDAPHQRIDLTVPVEWLNRSPTRLGFSQPELVGPDPASRVPGVLFNYDVSAQGTRSAGSVSAWTEQRLFGLGPGVWTNAIVTRAGTSTGSPTTLETVRLDSTWELDFERQMISVVAGDTLTSSLAWTRPGRIGGVRVSRNFNLQPYRVTIPLASFTGEAVLPSTVDLFINGARQSSEQVQPGRFQLDTMPAFQGLGQARMVITDINGLSRVVDLSLYSAPNLLQKGLFDWSAEVGALRRDYGIRSFSYDAPVATASGRYGLRDWMTIEGHTEAARDLQLAGAGGVWLLGKRWGVLNGAAAASGYHGAYGGQGTVGYEWQTQVFSAGGATQIRTAEFNDIGSLDGSPPPVRVDRAFVSVGLPFGRAGAAFVSQEQEGLSRSRFVSVNWSRSWTRAGYLSLNVTRDLDRAGGDSAMLYWSVPLGRRVSVSASARRTDGSNGTILEAFRAVDGDRGGWGWRAQVAPGDNSGAQGDVTYLSQYGQWTAGGTWQDTATGASAGGYANASGSALLMRGRLRAMRRVDDAFALVSTGGIPSVPIKLENRVVGYTDDRGYLLVSRLNAWQRNRLSIDPLDLPEDTEIDRVEVEAVPPSRSGVLATFAVRSVVSVQLVLRDPAGVPLPVGSAVRLAASPTAPPLSVVGYDGVAFLENPPAGARLRVGDGDRACSVTLPSALPARGVLDLGELTCR
jgi:outer membrane usher protein